MPEAILCLLKGEYGSAPNSGRSSLLHQKPTATPKGYGSGSLTLSSDLKISFEGANAACAGSDDGGCAEATSIIVTTFLVTTYIATVIHGDRYSLLFISLLSFS